jgi:putative colanic acid biosynthesis acetyltransferase WcaF
MAIWGSGVSNSPETETTHPGGQDTDARHDWRRIDLSRYNNSWWRPGRGRLVQSLWRWVGLPLLRHLPCETFGGRFFNACRIRLLRLFGACVGREVVIRACEVYYPWNLRIGEHVWVGYEANLYSLVPIILEDHTVVSQRSFLCTGSHDISDPAMGLVVGEITIKRGAWVCAGVFVGPGVTLHEGSVAAAGAVVVKDLPAMTVWGGNPARLIRPRILKEDRPGGTT